MFLRILTEVGTSKGVLIPVQILRAMKWIKGDYIQVSVMATNKILLQKVDIARIPDSILELSKEIPIIKING